MKTLTQSQSNTITDIAMDTILKNMKSGASFEQAQEQFFNRMNNEYPATLAAWILNNKEN